MAAAAAAMDRTIEIPDQVQASFLNLLPDREIEEADKLVHRAVEAELAVLVSAGGHRMVLEMEELE